MAVDPLMPPEGTSGSSEPLINAYRAIGAPCQDAQAACRPGPHTACRPSPLIGSCAELITTSCPAHGAQIFEGRGEVKVTRMKRKLSEHASSIGGDEQNLDIPKRLESSQAPEPNEPTATCGAVVQYASGTCTTAAQGLKNRRKRI